MDKLEPFVRKAPAADRDAILVKVAHYYSQTSAEHSEHDIAQFGKLLEEFADLIESVALAKVSFYLAGIPNAPAAVVCRLAEHADIVISGPLLTHSVVLTEPALVSIARSKSQAHLLAISERRTLSEGLTDILLDRGEKQVLHSVTSNPGARFSIPGVDKLVTLATSDDVLAANVIVRRDISSAQLKRVIAVASDKVREKMTRLHPHIAHLVNEAVTAAAEETRSAVRSAAQPQDDARIRVGDLFSSGSLNEEAIRHFARRRQFKECVVALALLSGNDFDEAERMVAEFGSEATLTLARAIGLSWQTTEAILKAQHRQNGERGLPARELNDALATFSRLKKDIARRVVSFRVHAAVDATAAEVLPTAAAPPKPAAGEIGP